MHCHNADQTFCVREGECTMHFPDGEKPCSDPGTSGPAFAGKRLERNAVIERLNDLNRLQY
jgi:hypothetical protein